MSLLTTEIVVVPSSEAYRADKNVLINGLGPLSKVDGLESIYFGIQLEDPKTAYVFNTARLDHSGPPSTTYRLSILPKDARTNGSSVRRPATISHVQFASDVTDAFKQPVTEIVFYTANSPDDKQKALGVFAQLAKSTNAFATYGTVEEKDNVVVFIAGWQSVEAHLEIVKAPHLHNILVQLPTLGTAEVKHVKLTSYSS